MKFVLFLLVIAGSLFAFSCPHVSSCPHISVCPHASSCPHVSSISLVSSIPSMSHPITSLMNPVYWSVFRPHNQGAAGQPITGQAQNAELAILISIIVGICIIAFVIWLIVR